MIPAWHTSKRSSAISSSSGLFRYSLLSDRAVFFFFSCCRNTDMDTWRLREYSYSTDAEQIGRIRHFELGLESGIQPLLRSDRTDRRHPYRLFDASDDFWVYPYALSFPVYTAQISHISRPGVMIVIRWPKMHQTPRRTLCNPKSYYENENVNAIIIVSQRLSLYV